MSTGLLSNFYAGASFLRSLPSYLRHPVTPGEARTMVRERLTQREDAFLYMLQHAIYNDPRSPYLQLLHHAGCEYQDIERSTRRDGIETTLESLFRAGVYLTVDELKVQHEALRGTTRVDVSPELVRNPLSRTHLWRSSGGSRAITVVGVDLRDLRDVGMNFQLFIDARHGMNWRHAIWTVPGATVYRILEFAGMGFKDFVCFTQTDPGRLHPYYRWSESLTRWTARLAGCSLPRPKFASVDDPQPIIGWMRDVLRSGDIPHLWTSVSSAVRLCLAAEAFGVDLERAQLTVSGEPLTGSRMEVLRRVGVTAVACYGSAETAWIGNGCLSPHVVGEQHLFEDRVAVIQPGRDKNDRLSPDALFVTSLRPSAPLVCLNLSLGDEAVLTTRECSCEMDSHGWSRHAHSIRSYEKLTTAGMSFLDHDLIEILEVALPKRFGGSPTDYQLVEKDGPNGISRLILRVNPSIGHLDEELVKEAFLGCLGIGSGREYVMADLIRNTKLLVVERRAPEITAGGKILHLQVSETKSHE